VRVDGRPICAVCGTGIQLTGPNRWRHVPKGRRYTGKSKWLSPVTLEELRKLETYEDFGARFPWAVRADFGGPVVTTEDHWREGIRRLERYHAALEEIRHRRRLRPGENPYLDLVRILAAPHEDEQAPRARMDGDREWAMPPGLYQMLHPSERRRELAALFAWAIPGDEELDALARYAPLVECGAGMGYWTALLRLRGVDALAYDLFSPKERARGAREPWTEVHRDASVVAVSRHRDRVLFLCWPPHERDDASYEPLRAYRGEILIYVGESGEGVTGTLRFHRELALNWTPIEEIAMPRWPWLRDRLVVYRRNDVRRPLLERDRCDECRRFMPTGSIGRCDRCFECRPPAVALRVGAYRVEYPAAFLNSVPAVLRTALEESPNRIR
jgi:hypothetical protein